MNDQRIVNYSLQSDMIVSKKVTLVPTKLPTQVTNVYKKKFSLHNISSQKLGLNLIIPLRKYLQRDMVQSTTNSLIVNRVKSK